MKILFKVTRTIVYSYVCLMVLTACSESDEGAARIVVGTSSTIFDLNPLQYQKPYVVQVSDVDGNAAANVQVRISVKNIAYVRGQYVATGSGYAVVGEVTGVNGNGALIFADTEECPAEDINNNGVLDTGEDTNMSGFLEPTNAAIVGAHPDLTPTLEAGSNSITTDDFGSAYFSLTYPKSEANWTIVEIAVSADVIGSENVSIIDVTLATSVADITDETVSPPGGGISSYGLGACPII